MPHVCGVLSFALVAHRAVELHPPAIGPGDARA